MGTMFNTEVIVKDMKGGREDMTEKPKLRYMNRFTHQNKVIYDNLTEEYWNVDNNFTAQSLTNVLNNLNDELNQNKELVDIFKSSIKKYDILRIIGWCCLIIGYFIVFFYNKL